MINTISELIEYLKNPVLEKDKNKAILYRFRKFFDLLAISIITTFSITFVIGFLELFGLLETGKHAMDQFKDASGAKLILLAVVIAPILEECIFRAPMVLFKKPSFFRAAFYTFTIVFAYMHIANYEITTNVLVFSPLLVAPQFFIGLYLGFIRIRLGLLWAIALHAAYNGFLVSLFLAFKDAIS